LNGRIYHDDTPEGRLAAVARSLVIQMEAHFRKMHRGPKEPDYADYREAFAPYIKRELLLARIDEARNLTVTALTARMRELSEQLYECESQIPAENRL
jgi:hypothetical protein